MIGLGTFVNAAAVLGGSVIGMFLKGGLKKRFQDSIMQAVGIATIFIGISGTLQRMFSISDSSIETSGIMMMVVSLVSGTFLGELLDIEKRLDTFGNWLKLKVKGKNDSNFVEGFVTASLNICVGAMAVVGAIQDGINADPSILYAKSVLDFVVILILASTFGKGVLFSVLPLSIYEGFLTLLARIIAPVLTDQMITNLSYVGSVLIFCVGVNMAFGKKIKVGNMLPSLIVAVFFGLLA